MCPTSHWWLHTPLRLPQGCLVLHLLSTRIPQSMMTNSKTSKGIKVSGKKFNLHVFSDADWAGDTLTRRSTRDILNSYVLEQLHGSRNYNLRLLLPAWSPNIWHAAMQGLVWFRGVLRKLGLSLTKPTSFFIDSKSAKDLSENLVYPKRSEHIRIKHHWVRGHLNGKFPIARLIQCIFMTVRGVWWVCCTVILRVFSRWAECMQEPHVVPRESSVLRVLVVWLLLMGSMKCSSKWVRKWEIFMDSMV